MGLGPSQEWWNPYPMNVASLLLVPKWVFSFVSTIQKAHLWAHSVLSWSHCFSRSENLHKWKLAPRNRLLHASHLRHVVSDPFLLFLFYLSPCDKTSHSTNSCHHNVLPNCMRPGNHKLSLLKLSQSRPLLHKLGCDILLQWWKN